MQMLSKCNHADRKRNFRRMRGMDCKPRLKTFLMEFEDVFFFVSRAMNTWKNTNSKNPHSLGWGNLHTGQDRFYLACFPPTK